MAKKAAVKKETPKGLDVKVKISRDQKLTGQRISITVTLLQDGEEIASSDDFVTIPN